tara:strand:+ start:264 stop:1505 length:1242 start_codon:yes stop_codon:yes gene_type:complete
MAETGGKNDDDGTITMAGQKTSVEDLLSDSPRLGLVERDQSMEKDPNPMNYLKYIYKKYAPEKYEKMKEGLKAAGNPIHDEDNDDIYEEWKKNYEESNKEMDEKIIDNSSSSSKSNKNDKAKKRQEENEDDFEISLPASDDKTILQDEDLEVGDLPMCKTDNFFEEVDDSSQLQGQKKTSYLPSLVERTENMSIVDMTDENIENIASSDEGESKPQQTKDTESNDNGSDDSTDNDDDDDEHEDEEVNYAIHGPPSSIEFVLPLESMGTYRVPPIRTDADRFLELYIEQMKNKDKQKVNQDDKPTVFYNDNFRKRYNEIIVDGPGEGEEEEDDDDDDDDESVDNVEVLEGIEDLPSGKNCRVGAIIDDMRVKFSNDDIDMKDSGQNDGDTRRGERSFTTVEMICEDEEALPSEL